MKSSPVRREITPKMAALSTSLSSTESKAASSKLPAEMKRRAPTTRKKFS